MASVTRNATPTRSDGVGRVQQFSQRRATVCIGRQDRLGGRLTASALLDDHGSSTPLLLSLDIGLSDARVALEWASGLPGQLADNPNTIALPA